MLSRQCQKGIGKFLHITNSKLVQLQTEDIFDLLKEESVSGARCGRASL